MIDRAVAGRRVGERVRLRARERDIFGEALRRQLVVYDEDERCAGDGRDRLEVLDRVERKLRIEARVDRLRARIGHEQRVAVGRGLRDRVGADDAARAGAILDHDGLAPLLAQQLPDLAREHVGRAARRLRDDQLDDLRRERLRCCGCRRQAGAAKRQCERSQPHSSKHSRILPRVSGSLARSDAERGGRQATVARLWAWPGIEASSACV